MLHSGYPCPQNREKTIKNDKEVTDLLTERVVVHKKLSEIKKTRENPSVVLIFLPCL